VSRTSTPLPKISSISTITSNNNVPSTSTNTSLPIQPTTTVKSVDKPTFNSKLDFLKISIKISTIFDKNANGKMLLNELFAQLNKISPHPLLETKMGLLGYLMEFLADFCEILVEG